MQLNEFGGWAPPGPAEQPTWRQHLVNYGRQIIKLENSIMQPWSLP